MTIQGRDTAQQRLNGTGYTLSHVLCSRCRGQGGCRHAPTPNRRQFGFESSLLLTCAAGLLLLLLFAAPASASHIKGGSIIAAIGAGQHVTGHVGLIYSSPAACPAPAAQLTVGVVQISGPSAFSASAPVTDAAMTACLPSTKTEGGEFDVDLSGAPDGTYTATYTNCCRVAPIANVAGASTTYRGGTRGEPASRAAPALPLSACGAHLADGVPVQGRLRPRRAGRAATPRSRRREQERAQSPSK